MADGVAALVPGTPAAKAADPQPGHGHRARAGAPRTARRGTRPDEGTVKAAFIHHTVSANDYSRSEAPSVVLGICRFHRNSNGWSDIGYNFLVDKYGTLYEGRAGGVDRAVVGAQAQGYNAQTTGIANIGTHTSVPQSSAALDAMARLIRWKLPLHGAPTAGSTTVTSAGGSTNKLPLRPQRAPRARGRAPGHERHRAAPATALYAQLPDLRARVGDVSRAARERDLTAKLTPRTATYKGRVKVAGRLTKFDGSPVTGTRVGVQARTSRGKYRTVAKVSLDSDGNYETVVRPRGTALRARALRRWQRAGRFAVQPHHAEGQGRGEAARRCPRRLRRGRAGQRARLGRPAQARACSPCCRCAGARASRPPAPGP